MKIFYRPSVGMSTESRTGSGFLPPLLRRQIPAAKAERLSAAGTASHTPVSPNQLERSHTAGTTARHPRRKERKKPDRGLPAAL